ncbi:hypothetical protein ABZ896_07830 [Streptomyces sp. NPDC047072]|uniref:hypothetical protein n=1 Tax=Streptomyces sp. NPDC047072 TaxID=3154809 RepID=UPI0033CB3EBC
MGAQRDKPPFALSFGCAQQRGAGKAPNEHWDALRRTVEGISERTHPHIAALDGALLMGEEPEGRLSWGFRTPIAGIE